MLSNWNFKDDAANSSTPQINRQKSARNLDVIEFDPSEPRAVFFDPKRGERHTATLTECDCADFNFAGLNPRKSFKPCMHIYRLGIELGLIEAKYLDHDARFALAGVLSREETARLQGLAPDALEWGGWASGVHASGIQLNRQYRAYLIMRTEPGAVRPTKEGWIVHDYRVCLDGCECADFFARGLPCKHIYVAALVSGIALPLTESEYEAARKEGREMVFEFPLG